MPTFLVLFEKTDEGRKITAEEAQQRRAKGIELIDEHDAELKALYYGFSEIDMAAIVEVDSAATMAKIKLGYEQQGLSKTRGFEVFEPEEWDAILEEAL